MVGEYGRCASRVSSASVPRESIMRMAAAASSAAWLLPTMRYLLCMLRSVVLVQPDRLLRAAPLRFARQRDGAGEMLVGDVGAGEPANETDGGDRFAGAIECA